MHDRIAFVAGATGYTGREVVRELALAGVGTVAHVRPDSPELERWRARFGELGAQIDATAWSIDAMTATLSQLRPSLVFALVGTTRKRAGADGLTAAAAYEGIDYGLTKLLLDASVAAASRPRFVYLSALGARENSGSAYFDARWRAEQAIQATDLPWTIARPSLISGPDRDEARPAERAAAIAADAVLGVLGALGARRTRDRYASMQPADLARGLVRAALDPASARVILHAESLRGSS
jgi:uncharacterized protein YbjT (DUF2867 family)